MHLVWPVREGKLPSTTSFKAAYNRGWQAVLANNDTAMAPYLQVTPDNSHGAAQIGVGPRLDAAQNLAKRLH